MKAKYNFLLEPNVKMQFWSCTAQSKKKMTCYAINFLQLYKRTTTVLGEKVVLLNRKCYHFVNLLNFANSIFFLCLS